METDSIGIHYIRMVQSECFYDTSVFVVELPVSEHKRPEVLAAKKKEI